MKVNKYVVKATVHTVVLITAMSLVAAVARLALDYINPTGPQILGALGIVFFGFCLYNMIKIQASILETKDKLNQK